MNNELRLITDYDAIHVRDQQISEQRQRIEDLENDRSLEDAREIAGDGGRTGVVAAVGNRSGCVARLGVGRVDEPMSELWFNEIDPYAAQWLGNLFPAATIDRRSIADVRPDDLVGRRRCHFFAGIAGWELALQWAGWPEDREVWTGSCPCQPFSAAGKRRGEADERHLWPELLRLIRERRPPAVFGEQVASRDGYRWLDRVFADLEDAGYAVGAADLPAACVGAPFAGQRLFWVATSNRYHESACIRSDDMERVIRKKTRWSKAPNGSSHNGDHGHWGRDIAEWKDGISRRTEPRILPLVDGISGSVGQLRALGNAIVPQVAAKFVRAFLDATA